MGGEIKYQDKDGNTAAHIAAKKVDVPGFFALFQEGGAAMDIKNKAGETPNSVMKKARVFLFVRDEALDNKPASYYKSELRKCINQGGDLYFGIHLETY